MTAGELLKKKGYFGFGDGAGRAKHRCPHLVL